AISGGEPVSRVCARGGLLAGRPSKGSSDTISENPQTAWPRCKLPAGGAGTSPTWQSLCSDRRFSQGERCVPGLSHPLEGRRPRNSHAEASQGGVPESAVRASTIVAKASSCHSKYCAQFRGCAAL